jgi:hypothetical protein
VKKRHLISEHSEGMVACMRDWWLTACQKRREENAYYYYDREKSEHEWSENAAIDLLSLSQCYGT